MYLFEGVLLLEDTFFWPKYGSNNSIEVLQDHYKHDLKSPSTMLVVGF